MDAPNLVLALPSKGRLHELSVQFLSQCGLTPERTGNGREYSARLAGTKNTQVVYFRPDEIPARVEQGEAHAGVTGEDLYREFGEGPGSHLVLRDLGFGTARLVVAVPQSWIDVSTLHDLDEAASHHRRAHGRGLRVATKFPRLTRSFFAQHGVADYRIVESLGATEGAPAAGVADFVVDLSSTGTTLAQNHLKEIAGGTLLRTHACLIASLRGELWTQTSLPALEQMVEQVEARQRARDYAVLRFPAPAGAGRKLRSVLASEHSCSIIFWSVRDDERPGEEIRTDGVITCPRGHVFAAATAIRVAGGGPVLVDHCEFLFDEPSRAFDRFRQILRRQGALPPQIHQDGDSAHGHD